MDKLHERKMYDSYKSPNGKCLKKFEFVKKFKLVECRNSRKIDGKSMNIPNREGVHKMYRQSSLVEKFLLKVQNNKNSMEKYVHQMYRSYEFV